MALLSPTGHAENRLIFSSSELTLLPVFINIYLFSYITNVSDPENTLGSENTESMCQS